jgi:hypothetical protein
MGQIFDHSLLSLSSWAKDPSINQKLVVHTTGTPAFGNLALMDHINSQLPE